MSGAMQEFPGIACDTDDGEFQARTDGTPYAFSVDALGSGTGRHTTQFQTFDYAGLDTSTTAGSSLELDCEASPVSGSITTGNSRESVWFTCQR